MASRLPSDEIVDSGYGRLGRKSVPGSGPSLDGTQWVPCRHTQATRRKPATPFLAGEYESPGFVWGVFVSEPYAYIANGENGFRILRLAFD